MQNQPWFDDSLQYMLNVQFLLFEHQRPISHYADIDSHIGYVVFCSLVIDSHIIYDINNNYMTSFFIDRANACQITTNADHPRTRR